MSKQYDPGIPAMENHSHLCFPQPVDDSVKGFEALCAQLSISRLGLLSGPRSDHNEPYHDILENLKVLYVKDRLSLPCYA